MVLDVLMGTPSAGFVTVYYIFKSQKNLSIHTIVTIWFVHVMFHVCHVILPYILSLGLFDLNRRCTDRSVYDFNVPRER